MKRVCTCLTAIILALGVLPVCALATTAESPLIIGGAGYDVCYDTLSLPNGNIILSLSSNGGQNGGPEYKGDVHKVWLLCLAPDGSVVWETEFGEDAKGGHTRLQHLALSGDGTFYGTVCYEISQYTQYRQKITFSCADGSILSEGEKVMEDENYYRRYLPNDGFTLVSESLTSGTSVDSPTLRMLDANGNELWKLDADVIGYTMDWLPTAHGALLYGVSANAAQTASQAAAALIDNSGRVVWTYRAENLDSGRFFDGMIDSGGRFVASGFCNYKSGQDSSQQLLVCLDAATGTILWQQTAGTADRILPNAHLTEIDGQYILCGSSDHYSITFETVDREGRELQCWTTSIPGYTLISPRFFLWNGELWTETLLKGSDRDAVLERVVIPDSR